MAAVPSISLIKGISSFRLIEHQIPPTVNVIKASGHRLRTGRTSNKAETGRPAMRSEVETSAL
jgi:hypothetical protein